ARNASPGRGSPAPYGLLASAGGNLCGGLVTATTVLGLGLAFFLPGLIHTVLRLQPLNHGLQLTKKSPRPPRPERPPLPGCMPTCIPACIPAYSLPAPGARRASCGPHRV